MSTVLTFYNEQIYYRYLLPADNNADHFVTLVGKKLCLERNLKLHLEVINRTWRVIPGRGYMIGPSPHQAKEDRTSPDSEGVCPPTAGRRNPAFPAGGKGSVAAQEGQEESGSAIPSSYALKDGMQLEIRTQDGCVIGVLVREDEFLHPYRKYAFPGAGRVVVGTDDTCDIRIPGQQAFCFRIDHEREQAYLENLSDGTLYHNAIVVRGRVQIQVGDEIDFPGNRLVYLGSALALEHEEGVKTELAQCSGEEDAAQSVAQKDGADVPEEAEKLYRRSPRKLENLDTGVIDIEAPPDPFVQRKLSFRQMVGNSVLMVIPMLMGSMLMIIASRQQTGMTGLFMYSGLVMALSSAVVGIIWAVVSARSSVADQKAQENHRFEAYSAYLIAKADEIRGHYSANKERLLSLYPDASVCLDYNSEGTKLWNRNWRQYDFLKIMAGIGNIPFQMEIHTPEPHFSMTDDSLRMKPEWIRKNYETLYDVPVLLDLKAHPLCALVGGEEKFGAFALMRALVLHLAATHCYTDVKLVFLYDSDVEAEEWEFAKWLPHTWAENRKIRYTAGTPSEISDVCYELTRIFHERLDSRKGKMEDGRNKEVPLPYFVLFLSDPRLIEGERLSSYVYKNAEKAGLTTIILSDFRENLPNECEYFLYRNELFEGIISAGGRTVMTFDKVGRDELEAFARGIAGVRVKETSSGGEIPSAVTFLEMYKVSTVDQLRVRERWLKNRTYDNVRALLGVKGGGEPVYLDLHEKYHGPHGLVAGTTGSGKSETLQTYLLSLAVEYSPDDISFFVIDYKGGGMANLFEGLPHLSGFISNLSGPQINRALVSIKSENRRRQMLFNEAHVNNINRYTRLYKEGAVRVPIPHLLIVIDEFAELKKEEPDFMRELISVAQVGRSLGVHLILSTQKPSGTVDDNIWSNSNFRLCLRVQTKEDSVDMLGNPDAAYITQAGRGYLQVGNQELYEMFQSGYSGAAYAPEESSDGEATSLLDLTGRTEYTYKGAVKAAGQAQERSQLDAVREYLAGIAAAEGYAGGHQLWMPVLGNPIYLDAFAPYQERAADQGGYGRSVLSDGQFELSCVIGQMDDPQNQAQDPLWVGFAEGGHHAVIGSIVSGKSTLLQTIVYSLVTTYPPNELNVYAIDYSSRFLAAFEELPHVGGVMFDGEEERTARFFNMLDEMLEERKKKFRGGNYAQYVKANGVEDPAVLLVIDNFAAFNEKTQEKYLQRLIRLSKEGVSCGIFLLISAGGFGMSELPNRLAENMGTVLTLALPDKFSYADVLRLTRVNLMPETQLRGRGLCRVGEGVLEYQTALALPAADDFQRMESIRRRCAQLNAFGNGYEARRIPEIPENPTIDLFLALPGVQEALGDDRYLPVGYRKDDAKVYSLDLHEVYCCLIAGQKRSGKSSLMRLMVLEVLRKGRLSAGLAQAGTAHADPAQTGTAQAGTAQADLAQAGTAQAGAAQAGSAQAGPASAGIASADAQKGSISPEESDYAKTVLIDPDGKLKDLHGCDGLRLITTPEELYEYCINELTPVFHERNVKKHVLAEQGLEGEEYYEGMAGYRPVFIFITNLVTFMKQVHADTHSMKEFMGTLLRKGEGHKITFIAILPLEDRGEAAGYEAFNLFTQYRTGIHTGGNISQDPYLSFETVDFKERSKAGRPGTAMAPEMGTAEYAVQLVIPYARRKGNYSW